MRMKLCILSVLSSLALVMTGCVSTLDGHSKMGVPFGKDKIESRYERPAEQIFTAAKEVLKFNGVLTSENTISNIVEAKVNTRTIWVKAEQIDPKVSKVTVQARTKGGGTDIDMASEIDKQIALRLVGQQ